MDSNIFITKLHDIIIPESTFVDTESQDQDEMLSQESCARFIHRRLDSSGQFQEENRVINMNQFNFLFIVMELIESDFRHVLDSGDKT